LIFSVRVLVDSLVDTKSIKGNNMVIIDSVGEYIDASGRVVEIRNSDHYAMPFKGPVFYHFPDGSLYTKESLEDYEEHRITNSNYRIVSKRNNNDYGLEVDS